MKTLTIRQPWASLIVEGYKHYEFRSWKTNYRGKFYIHAGLDCDKKCIHLFDKYKLSYPNGAIIGEAEIVDCSLVDDSFKEKLSKENELVYAKSSGYAFVLKNIKKYEQPISCKGKLSFWEYPDAYKKDVIK